MSASRRQQLPEAGRKVKAPPRPNLFERRLTTFLKEPPKLRAAAGVIVTATALVVVGGGVLLRVVDLLAHRRVDPTDGRAGGLINRRPSLSGDRSWR